MPIVALDIKNVKRIAAAHIEPDGSVIILGGRNAQGKSSILDAIQMLLCGKDAMPPEPLKRGAETGHVSADLGDVIVTRTFTPAGGGSLKVEAKIADGIAVMKSPQKWLDERIGKLSFDPMAFMRADEKAQAEMFRQLTGCDTRELDGKRKAVFDERTLVNRQGRDAEGALASLVSYPDAPAEPVSAEAINAELSAARKANADREAAVAEANKSEISVQQWAKEVARLESELTRARESQRCASDAAMASLHRLESMPTVDESSIVAKFDSITKTNQQVEANRTRSRALANVDALATKAKGLTAQLAALDETRASMLRDAKCPVAGLGLNADGMVTFNDLPLSQASDAEQVELSMSLSLAMNPGLKVVLIREGSTLDRDAMALVAKMAEEAGAQVWIERVDDRDAGAIIIEDGNVLEAK